MEPLSAETSTTSTSCMKHSKPYKTPSLEEPSPELTASLEMEAACALQGCCYPCWQPVLSRVVVSRVVLVSYH
jgi:hypothetical protein